MNEDFYAKSDQIAQKYLSAHQKIGAIKGKDFVKTQDTISKLEKAKQNLSETSLLRTRLKEQITELKKQTDEASELEKEFDAIRQEFLEFTAASFEIDPHGEKSLSENYIRALTDALFKRERVRLEFHECLVEPRRIEIKGDETKNLLVCVNISTFVQDAAKQVLGKGTMPKELWNRITNADTMFKVYSILASSDKVLTAIEIASLINEEGWDRVKVKNTLVNLLLDDLFPQKLIRRVEEGKYQVSDVGRFLWLEFGSSKKETKEKSATPLPKNPSQAALNRWSES